MLRRVGSASALKIRKNLACPYMHDCTYVHRRYKAVPRIVKGKKKEGGGLGLGAWDGEKGRVGSPFGPKRCPALV